MTMEYIRDANGARFQVDVVWETLETKLRSGLREVYIRPPEKPQLRYNLEEYGEFIPNGGSDGPELRLLMNQVPENGTIPGLGTISPEPCWQALRRFPRHR